MTTIPVVVETPSAPRPWQAERVILTPLPRDADACGSLSAVYTVDVLAFVRASLPEPPARVLEVGAGDGELAADLRGLGYDVLAIDPASETGEVARLALHEVAPSAEPFDAAVAVVSLHHVEPCGSRASGWPRWFVRAAGW